MATTDKHLMVVIDGVRYRATDAKRLGLTATKAKPKTEPTEAKEASHGDDDAGAGEGPGNPAGSAGERPAPRARATKGK